jgi:hypothetical protein
MQSSGYVAQSVLQPNLCRDIQPIGGFRASPLSRAATDGTEMKGGLINAIRHVTTLSKLRRQQNCRRIDGNGVIAKCLLRSTVR